MVNLAKAVDQTRKYSAYFHSLLDDEGLHRWLISEEIVPKKLLTRFYQKLTQRQLLDIQAHQKISGLKVKKAKRIACFLSYFPPIRLIAVTGSLAMDNARVDDDLDIFIITRADTLWLTRFLVILFLKVMGLRRPTSLPEHHSPIVTDKVCDNLWLDEAALALPKNKRNLYTAHEVLQAKPIFDRGGTYAKFILANSWTKKYLANAYKLANSNFPSQYLAAKRRSRVFPRDRRLRQGEVSGILKFLNHLAFRLQYSYMKSKITRETITVHSAYFHPNDYALIDLDG